MKQNLNIPRSVYLYDEGVKGLNFKSLKSFLNDNFGRIPVRMIRLKDRVVSTKGLALDILNTNRAFEKLESYGDKDSCHVILTDKLFAIFQQDRRLHLSAAIFGFPCIISTSGIIEAPAKPKEYYMYKQRYGRMGMWQIREAEVKEKFKGRFIDYGDSRMSEVLKGYLAQALFFYITGEPFCRIRGCRLFNSHWQEDLIYAQVTKGVFCSKHSEVLKNVKNFS